MTFLMAMQASSQGKRYHGDGIDDVLRFVPVASAYILKASGMEGASSWKRLTVNTVMSYALATGVTYGLKHTIHDMRPDRTDHHSFPSGHTVYAFAGATLLDKEYRRRSPWISVAGYGMAALTAADRVRRNRHEWDDVLAGAAIGILATETGYWIGDRLTGEHSRFHMGVSPAGLSLALEL